MKPPTTIFPEGVHRSIYARLLQGPASAWDLIGHTGHVAATRRLREARSALREQGWTVSCSTDPDGVKRYRLAAMPGALKQGGLFGG